MSANFSPTPAEWTLVNQIFQHADPQKLGVVTGDAAIKVFDGAKLPASILGEIWAFADEDNNGWLSRKGVAAAVRLMGWAQKGERLSDALLQKPGPIPKIEGINTIAQQNTGMSLPKSPLPYFPPLTPQDKEKFNNIFSKAGPTNGVLTGEKARDIFLKSRLPNEQLVSIWNLADTQDRGCLDATDFAIGMYFIQGLMSKKITFIPSSLPPGLYNQAGGGGGVVSQMTGNSGSFSPPPGSNFNIQPQYTGQMSQLQPNTTGVSVQARSPALPPRPAIPSIASRSLSPPVQPPTPAWDVTPAEKAACDAWFDDLDKEKKGYIEGSVAVPFMVQSNLPGEILANIWDLADVNSDGQLTRDGFAVAMHLIQKKLAGGEIPASLPPSLIPPSMRQSQPEPQKDLFSFDDSPPPSAVQPQPTSGFAGLQPQRTGPLSSLSPQATDARSTGMSYDPFTSTIVPTSYTGSSHNLLDDDEPSVTSTSAPLQDQSAEIGNVKIQLTSTNKSLEKTRSEREVLEQTLSTQAAQLSALQIQLSSAKAAYETEIKLFSTLKDRHTSQQAEIEKTRQELISAESDLSAKRVEKAEIEGAFMRDKEDHRELNRRIIEVGQQIETLKGEIERVKKDAKQQKGLLAIAKKQLATKEAERVKVEKELQEANEDLAEAARETEETEAAVAKIEMPVATTASPPARTASADVLAFAAAQPLPGTPDSAVSPSVSIKSNNPFERLAMSGSTSRTQTPFSPFPNAAPSKSTVDTSLDDIFGLAQLDKQSEEGGSQSVEGLPYDTPEPKDPESFNLANGLNIPPTSQSQQTPLSPNETELFHTPPTSARDPSPDSTLDGVSHKFPAIDSVTAQVSSTDESIPSNPENVHGDIGTFDTKVQEFEVDESDSSDDDDEVPLAVLSQSITRPIATATDKGQESNAVHSPANNDQTFDDVFASEKPAETSTAAITDNLDDVFASSVAPLPDVPKREEAKPNGQATSVDGFPSIDNQPSVAGVDAFDEALGKIGTTSGGKDAAAPTFSFDTAFDDNFDFNAAKSGFPPVVSPPTSQTPIPAASTFDDIFSTPAVNGHSTEPTNLPTESEIPNPVNGAQAVSFDDAFGGETSALVSSPIPTAVSPVQISPPTSTSTNPFPASSPTASPKQTTNPTKPRPSSPLALRPNSPPPRIASPKPRLSSSSSKDSHEKPKEPAPRHSKLSIRLPFGKKKKQQQQQQQQHDAMPSTHLTPHKEQPERAVTPATDDDVEAVKQLTDMGFSRSQAVEALEKYGYDVPRALNNLLGAP